MPAQLLYAAGNEMYAKKVIDHYSPCVIYRNRISPESKIDAAPCMDRGSSRAMLKIVIEEKMLLRLLRELGICRLVAEGAGFDL